MPNPLILPLVVLGGVTVAGTTWVIARRRRLKDQLPPAGGGAPGGALPPGAGEPTAPGGGETPTGTPADAKSAAELIGPLVSPYTVGAFHPPQAGDSPAALARKAIKAIHPGATDQQVAAMRRALALSNYNRQVVGEPHEPGFYYPDGVSIDRAFLPKHEGVGILRAGYLPRRNIDASGKRIGTSQEWAPLWVPDVNEDALRAGVSDSEILFGGVWEDQTSALEPPPVFWENAVKRAPIGG